MVGALRTAHGAQIARARPRVLHPRPENPGKEWLKVRTAENPGKEWLKVRTADLDEWERVLHTIVPEHESAA
jgi:hypothetical protein